MTERTTDTDLHSMFLERWSPRAFDQSAIPDADIATIFEAGRWAPSAYNYQPWRFLYARRDDANWDRFLDILIPFNRGWAENAGLLVYMVSEKTMGSPDKANHTHSFDAGSAWAMMAIQAHLLGYHSHGMSGVDFEKAAKDLAVPDTFTVDMAFVVGRQAPKESLSEDLQKREEKSDRRPLAETAFAGNFTA